MRAAPQGKDDRVADRGNQSASLRGVDESALGLDSTNLGQAWNVVANAVSGSPTDDLSALLPEV
jgi:hypothetical protein